MRRIFLQSCVFIFAILFLPVRAQAASAPINTVTGNDCGTDCINFSQGRVWVIDKYGKYIWLTENRLGDHSWAWSNDNGTTWTQSSESQLFLTRGSVAYDQTDDKLHVIWSADNNTDGIIYRRYGISRDTSNNVTAITREDSTNVNLQLDVSSVNFMDQPVALWINDGSSHGLLMAIWTKHGTGINEVRGTMRHLSLSAADGMAGNWVSINGTPDTFSQDPPLVSANKIYSNTIGNTITSAAIRGGSGPKKDDLYVFANENDSSGHILSYRAVWNSLAGNWSGGWQSPVTIGPSGSSTQGYSNKYELITKPVLDTQNDRLYIGWARWKDNTSGDTASLAYLNSSDQPSAVFDIYSANGVHSYAPTLDLSYNSNQHLIYAAYDESSTNGGNGYISYKTFDGTAFSSSTLFFNSGQADIPILYDNDYNNQLLFAFRKNGAIPPTALNPHILYFGYVNLPVATPTPTPVQIFSNNSQPIQNYIAGPVACEDTSPASPPHLFEIDASISTASLYFVPAEAPVNKYFISYSTGISAEQYGVEYAESNHLGVLTYTVGHLAPNTEYYFKIRGGNGCATGAWSKIMKISTGYFNRFYENHTFNLKHNSAVVQLSPTLAPSLILPTPTIIPTVTPLPTDTPPPAVVTVAPTPKHCILWWCF